MVTVTIEFKVYYCKLLHNHKQLLGNKGIGQALQWGGVLYSNHGQDSDQAGMFPAAQYLKTIWAMPWKTGYGSILRCCLNYIYTKIS